MATETIERPARTATRKAWAEYAADELGVDVTGLTKSAIISTVLELDEDDTTGDVELASADDRADADDLTDVPAALRFSATVEDDTDEDAAGPLNISIDGFPVTLSRPSDTALAIRVAEFQAADTVLNQGLALLGIISTSMDRTGYLYLREKMLAPRVEGEKFNDELLSNLVETIVDRWSGQQIDLDKKPGNREQRRAQGKKRR